MSDSDASSGAKDQKRTLSVQEYRELLGWQNASDEEVKEFLGSLRAYLSRFLDDYFHDEFPIDEIR